MRQLLSATTETELATGEKAEAPPRILRKIPQTVTEEVAGK
jgi:hypothetical protein